MPVDLSRLLQTVQALDLAVTSDETAPSVDVAGRQPCLSCEQCEYFSPVFCQKVGSSAEDVRLLS